MKDRVIWVNRGWQRCYIGLCLSEKAWRREMKRFGCPDEPFPEAAGNCTTFSKDDKTSLIVTIHPEKAKGQPPIVVLGLLVHESVHVWQAIRDDMGERSPSIEFEAYTVQAIFQELMWAWEDRSKKR